MAEVCIVRRIINTSDVLSLMSAGRITINYDPSSLANWKWHTDAESDAFWLYWSKAMRTSRQTSPVKNMIEPINC